MDREERYAIVWELDEDTGDSFLAYEHDDQESYEAPDASLEQLAELCDQDAESGNYHDFVGVHEKLGELLVKHVGEKTATNIIRDIAELGGLHGMNGLD